MHKLFKNLSFKQAFLYFKKITNYLPITIKDQNA